MARRLAIAKLAAWDRLTGFERRPLILVLSAARVICTDRPAMTLDQARQPALAARAKRKRRLGKLKPLVNPPASSDLDRGLPLTGHRTRRPKRSLRALVRAAPSPFGERLMSSILRTIA